jgi:16S rRNA (cytidine1402-2'-O)-methyltransferase
MALADWKKLFANEAACAALQNRPCVFLLLAH